MDGGPTPEREQSGRNGFMADEVNQTRGSEEERLRRRLKRLRRRIRNEERWWRGGQIAALVLIAIAILVAGHHHRRHFPPPPFAMSLMGPRPLVPPWYWRSRPWDGPGASGRPVPPTPPNG